MTLCVRACVRVRVHVRVLYNWRYIYIAAYDLQVDIYSMAMIFWYMAKGERPFEQVQPLNRTSIEP